MNMSNYKRYFKNSSNPVFITFVTYNRREILIQNIEALRNSFKYAKNKYDFEIIAISVLKEHCHMIISHQKIGSSHHLINLFKTDFMNKIGVILKINIKSAILIMNNFRCKKLHPTGSSFGKIISDNNAQ